MDANQYRERAAHARSLARDARDPVVRDQLETVATDYDGMAIEAENGNSPTGYEGNS